MSPASHPAAATPESLGPVLPTAFALRGRALVASAALGRSLVQKLEEHRHELLSQSGDDLL